MRLDYDRIAHLYDERNRDHAVDPDLLAWLEGRSDRRVRVADIGCGTGKQLAANRQRFPDVPMVGVDRSYNMLRIASGRAPSVTWVQGDGQALPLASASLDYVTNQYSYAHIPDTRAFFAEVFRVLRSGGQFMLKNIDPWSMPDWIIYRFFPEARAVDFQDFLPVDALTSLLREIGFGAVAVSRSEDCKEESLRGFLARDRHSASQFTAISDEAYEAGRRRVRAALAALRDDGADITVTSRAALILVRAERI